MTTDGNACDGPLEPIAIIGIGCRLAGDVNTAAEFWQFLLDGASAVGEVPADRWETVSAPRPAQRRHPGRDHPVRQLPVRSGRFRRRVLRGVPPRGRTDGPAAAVGAGGQLGGPGARRCAAAGAGGFGYRGADGRQLRRLRQARDGGPARDRGLDRHRHLAVRHRQPGVPSAGSARAQRRAGCGVRGLTGRGAPGLPVAAGRGDFAGAGRRCQCADRAGPDPGARRGRCHGPRRPVQILRRIRRRVRPR